MKQKTSRKIWAVILTITMLLSMSLVFMIPSGAEEPNTKTYTLDATADLTAFAAGAKADGDTEKAGTDDYFTLIYSTKTKVDGSSKTFEDNYSATQRINFGGKVTTTKNAVKITTSGAATVKLWWVCGGDDRSIGILDAAGEVVTKTELQASSAIRVDTLSLTEAGDYFIGGVENNSYIFKIEVTETISVQPTEITYTLDATADLTAFAAGAKADGDTEKAGTDDYFTLVYSEKTKVDGSNKDFEDGYSATQRINFGGKVTTTKNAVKITTSGAATVKLWWVCGGDDRSVGILDAEGEVVTNTELQADGAIRVDTLSLTEAGDYFIGGVENNSYIFKIEVTETAAGGDVEAPRKDWANVADPVISAADNGDGTIGATVNAVVGYDGADKVTVSMYYGELQLASYSTSSETNAYTATFTPKASGIYTIKASISREGEEDKVAEEYTVDFVLPLAAPYVSSVANKGDGKIALTWNAVAEAESYNVYYNGTLAGNTESRSYTVEGLTAGTEYSFEIEAVRGNDAAKCAPVTHTAKAEAEEGWGFTVYGPSTNSANNGYIENEDGSVTVYSESGKGKIQTSSTDGIAFYYQAIPTEYNFTLRAKITVDSWTLSNGQEGFGLLVADRLGQNGDASDLWNNQYMVLASKIEYRYNKDAETIEMLDGTGTKYSMKLGFGTLAKLGIELDELGNIDRSDFIYIMQSLESSAGDWDLDAGTYNVVGNFTAPVEGSLEERFLLTEFIVEIQKNNTGYFITYYDADGNIIIQQKNYGADDLNKLDDEFVYAGFFASRNARATFSDIELTTILASEDAPAEQKPTVVITPSVTISSSTVSTDPNYELAIDTNVNGTVSIYVENVLVAENVEVAAYVRYIHDIVLEVYGENYIRVVFTPDPDQDLGENTVLGNTGNAYANLTVILNKGNFHRKNIYVSPDVAPHSTTGTGSKENPYDIYTAVENATPGQTIILMGGRYYLTETLKIQRGMDGTADEPISMIADPEATERPVFDFQKLCAGIVHGGDYWYFYGFDVTNSANMQKGFQVSGNYNVLDQINAYYNGNTGIQLSRYSGTDLFPDWPAYNLILNCTSYGNADAGYEDADGFAAKLTVGEGNVFDGCIAYNNADDGWDLYAKVETGPIGAVTIKNCVAYANGILEDGTIAGNGNGFKMGGDSLSGKHKLINSIAFNNMQKGIDSNSCPDIIVENCISFNNYKYNVAFYTNNATDTDFAATGIISFKYGDLTSDQFVKDNLKPVGNQEVGKYTGNTNYYWNGTACVNGAGVEITADMFVSLEFNGFTRNADGSLNLGDFLKLNENAPENAVAALGTTPSADIDLPTDLEHNYSDAWVNTDPDMHWHECECGDKSHIGEHTYEWVIDREATATQNGLKHRECTVCGNKKPAIEIYPETPDEPAAPPQDTPDGDGEEGGLFDQIIDTVVDFFVRVKDFFVEIFNNVKDFFVGLFGKED